MPRAISLEHSDEFKRKKLFDFIGDAERALAAFNSADIPESISLVDLKSIEVRGERLGRAWPQAVKTLLEVVDRNAAAMVKSQTGDDGAKSPAQEAPRHGRPRAKV